MDEQIEIVTYYTDVLNGVACEKQKRLAEKILEAYTMPDEFHFDADIANRHTEFIERFCKIPSGRLGAPFKLELFQKAILQVLFGFVDDNNIRQYNESLLILGRKNGKTSLCSAIEIDMLCNDGEGAPQIYNVATMRDQAMLGFTACEKMRQLSPMLKKHLRKRATDIYFDKNMGFIKALASNTSSLDGLDVHCGVIDELSAIKNRDIYDLVKQAMTARKQPLLFCISTNGFLRNGIFDAQYEYAKKVLTGQTEDKRFLPIIYELDKEDDWADSTLWVKANPGLGTIKSEGRLRENVQKAKDDQTFKPTLLVKDFNVPQTNESAWLKYEEIENKEHWSMKEFDYCIGGFDAADSIDLNAAKAICMRPNDENVYVKSMYWLPESVVYADTPTRKERDNAPYKLWVEQGFLRTCEGNKCDKRIFLDWFVELRDDGLFPLYIGYDPWHISDELLNEFKMQFGKNCMIPMRQGARSETAPLTEMKADFSAHRVIYNENPIDQWCLINSVVKKDVNGNQQLVKNAHRNLRNDGTSALMCAYYALLENKQNYINYNEEKDGV